MKRRGKIEKFILYLIFFTLGFYVISYAGIHFGKVSAVKEKVKKLDKKIKSTMAYVPAGNFIMGSDINDNDEKPQHIVYLDAYYIDRFEVTDGRYAEFLNEMTHQTREENGYIIVSGEGGDWLNVSVWTKTESGKSGIRYENGKYKVEKEYENDPVSVTWYGAKAYAEWAGKRLPTEAEWEKAARGTDGRTYPWGEGLDSTRANYRTDPSYTDMPVGSFPEGVSPYGCYDMIGNAGEWCNDWYDENYYSVSPSSNPQGPTTGTYKIIRSPSRIEYLRCSKRFKFLPSGLGDSFRCVKDAN